MNPLYKLASKKLKDVHAKQVLETAAKAEEETIKKLTFRHKPVLDNGYTWSNPNPEWKGPAATPLGWKRPDDMPAGLPEKGYSQELLDAMHPGNRKNGIAEKMVPYLEQLSVEDQRALVARNFSAMWGTPEENIAIHAIAQHHKFNDKQITILRNFIPWWTGKTEDLIKIVEASG